MNHQTGCINKIDSFTKQTNRPASKKANKSESKRFILHFPSFKMDFQCEIKKKLIECLPRNWFREKFEIDPKSTRRDKQPLNGALFQARHLDGSWLCRQSAGGSSITVDLAPEQVRNVSFRHPLIHRRANNRTWIRCKWCALSPEISIGRFD